MTGPMRKSRKQFRRPIHPDPSAAPPDPPPLRRRVTTLAAAEGVAHLVRSLRTVLRRPNGFPDPVVLPARRKVIRPDLAQHPGAVRRAKMRRDNGGFPDPVVIPARRRMAKMDLSIMPAMPKRSKLAGAVVIPDPLALPPRRRVCRTQAVPPDWFNSFRGRMLRPGDAVIPPRRCPSPPARVEETSGYATRVEQGDSRPRRGEESSSRPKRRDECR